MVEQSQAFVLRIKTKDKFELVLFNYSSFVLTVPFVNINIQRKILWSVVRVCIPISLGEETVSMQYDLEYARDWSGIM